MFPINAEQTTALSPKTALLRKELAKPIDQVDCALLGSLLASHEVNGYVKVELYARFLTIINSLQPDKRHLVMPIIEQFIDHMQSSLLAFSAHAAFAEGTAK